MALRTDFENLQVGDIVTRLLAGVIPHRLRVTALDEQLIHCEPWAFDRRTLMEVDEDLGMSASFLRNYEPAAEAAEL